MNTESRYVFDDESFDTKGLGRLPAQFPNIHRSLPVPEETRRKKQLTANRRQPKTSQPRQKPQPRPIPRPIIDKNPIPPPPKLKPKKPKVITLSEAPLKKKNTSAAKVQKKKKPAGKKTAGKNGGMLDGTVKVAGIEIEKKHAAAAGGTTVGGLLLWKLLF